jgi:hypothetical protein
VFDWEVVERASSQEMDPTTTPQFVPIINISLWSEVWAWTILQKRITSHYKTSLLLFFSFSIKHFLPIYSALKQNQASFLSPKNNGKGVPQLIEASPSRFLFTPCPCLFILLCPSTQHWSSNNWFCYLPGLFFLSSLSFSLFFLFINTSLNTWRFLRFP